MPSLWEHPLSPYAQKVKIALREKGIGFDPTTPSLDGDPEFEAVSPRREVPVLVDGDAAIFDSTIILEYLEDRWPGPPMLPRDPADRARARMIEEVCDTQFEAVNWGLAEIRFFERAEGGRAERLLARARDQIGGLHAWLERELGRHEWFGADRFGWADLSVLPCVAAAAGFGHPPGEGSRLASWLARASARPAARTTLAEAARAAGALENAAGLLRRGRFVREYRDHRLEWMMRSGGRDVVVAGMDDGTIRFSIELA